MFRCRLLVTWQLVDQGVMETKFLKIKKFFSPLGNFSDYRKAVAELALLDPSVASSSLSLSLTYYC